MVIFHSFLYVYQRVTHVKTAKQLTSCLTNNPGFDPSSEISASCELDCWKLITHTMWGPQTIAKLVNITPTSMVCGTYITIVTVACKPTYNWGGHIVGSMVLLYMVCHGSHQYTPVMLAFFYQHQPDPSWVIKVINFENSGWNFFKSRFRHRDVNPVVVFCFLWLFSMLFAEPGLDSKTPGFPGFPLPQIFPVSFPLLLRMEKSGCFSPKTIQGNLVEQTQTLHGAGIFTYIYPKNHPVL